MSDGPKVTGGYRPGREMSETVAAQLRERRDGLGSRWRRDPGREASLLLIFVVALVTLVVAAFSAKVGTYADLGGDEDASYWMESAQRYRYVAMVASGEEIPLIDTRMQAPDGYPTRSDTIGQEILYGTLARERPEDWSVARSVRWMTRGFAALAVIPMVWLGWALTRRRDAALLAGVLYGLALPVAERGNGAVLFREDLAVPVLLLHLAALAGWARKPHWARALFAGLLLAGAMLLWKVVTLYSLLLLGFLATAWWLRRVEPIRIADGTFFLFAPAALASVAPWSLHYDQFLASTPALAAFGVTLGALVAARAPRAPSWLGPLIVVAAVVAGRLALPVESSYEHAWETILAKVRTLDTKPLDPTELSFHARHYWAGNYESPTLRRLARDWPWLAVVALPGLVSLVGQVRRAGVPWSGRVPPPPSKLLQGDGPSDPMSPLLSWFAVWLVLSFVGSYLLFVKLTLFAAIALASAGAIGWAYARRLRVLRRLAIAPFVLGVALHGLGVVPALEGLWAEEILQDADGVSEVVVFPSGSFGALSEWIARETAPDEAILASFTISPFLLTYLDRPTVLHCFFEGDMLERLETVVPARFGDEAALWRVAQSYGATWYVHEAHFALRTDPGMSQRYVAGAMEWPADSVTTRMQYAPETLEHFELAYENGWFRVFRVLPEGTRARNGGGAKDLPLWSRPLFRGLFGDPLGAPAATEAGAGLAPDDLFYATMKARSWIDFSAAHVDPGDSDANFPEREYGFSKASEVAPYVVDAHEGLRALYSQVGRADRAARARASSQRARGLLSGAVAVTPQDAPREVSRIR